MKDIHLIIWLFPIIFMFHDFEEIIFIKPWFAKNRECLIAKYPRLSQKLVLRYSSLSTSALALGIAGMFMLICIVTITAYMTDWYYLWFGVFIVFTIHLLCHCLPGFIVKGYVPAIITSVICLPICSYFIVLFLQLYKPDIVQVVFFSIVGSIVMLLNLWAVHKIMSVFDKWLNKYQNK